MRASLTAEELGEASQRTLERLGCRFYTNRTAEITEFEVIDPVKIIVRVTRLLDRPPAARFGTLFVNVSDLNSNRETSNLEIVLSKEGTSESQMASRFVRCLLNTLSKKPWQGLNSFETINAKAAWNSWAEKVQM